MKPLLQYAKQVLQDAINRIDNDECNEDTVGYVLGKLNNENNGNFNEHSFVNYDEAMKILNIGNREHLVYLTKKHGINQHTIKNRKMGFLRDDIEALTVKLQSPPVQPRKKKND